MKPRPVENGYFAKAIELEQRLERLMKADEEHKKKLVACLKKKGGAASLEEGADACGISKSECKSLINRMDNVQISRHGDVVLTDGLNDEELEKAGCMPSHKMVKADMATKDKYCMKNFGKKYSECSEKQKAQCDKVHGKMTKAEPGFKPEKITDINPAFYAESGGQTKSGYFTTNGRTIETEDAPKKKKGKESSDMERLSSRMNPHDGGGAERLDSAGEAKPLKKGMKSQMRESGAPMICKCGATPVTGCLGPFPGTDIHACPAYEPLR